MTIEKQLDRIEEKLDRLLKLLEQPTVTMTSIYPKAPHELVPILTYPWQPHETSSSP
jgi:hypothetical protein